MSDLSYTIVRLNNKKFKTVKDFLFEKDGFAYGLSAYDFLMFDANIVYGKKNIEKIYNSYDAADRAKYKSAVNTLISSSKDTVLAIQNEYVPLLTNMESLPIKNSPEVFIPNGNFNQNVVEIRGGNQFLEQKNIVGFWSDKLKEIITDENYVRCDTLGVNEKSSVEVVNENCQVWLWCRALNKIINLSPFIGDLNIQKVDVGSFSVSLSPVGDMLSVFSADNEDVINYFNFNNKNGDQQMDFFHRNIQQNDIIFIRFERLKSEKNDDENPYFDFEINKNRLPGRIWDMIGLVDNSSQNISYESSNYNLNINGRDLLKLLIEDGSYFLTKQYINSDTSKYMLVYNPGDKSFKRNVNGQFDPLQYDFLNKGRNISDSIGFIINQLSNLGVLGESGEGLFSSYKNKRSTIFKLGGTYKNELQDFTVEGIWQIIKVFVDEQLNKRAVIDPSSVSIDSPLIDQFLKLCQDPFVEFYGDTYGDEFNLIARQPPFTKESVISFLNSSFVTDSSLKPFHREIDTKIGSSKNKMESFSQGSVIDVDPKDLYMTSLDWDQTHYAWYQIEPCNNVFGSYTNLAVGQWIPIVFINKIAETFGNHRKIVVDNYLSFDLKDNVSYPVDLENYRLALLNDLKFIIDTNVYLPFTRKGTITLGKGDRRIKKGTFIRLTSTKEIFYVDGVINDIKFSSGKVDRSTVLTVSRGMVEDYIKGSVGYDHEGKLIKNGIVFSYFNLVNTDLMVKNLMSVDQKVNQQQGPMMNNVDSIYSVSIKPSSIVAYENNNPGNIMYYENNHYYTASKGSMRSTGAYWAAYKTPEIGFEAVMHQVTIDKGAERNLSIRSFSEKYMNGDKRENIEQRVRDTVNQLNFNFYKRSINETTLLADIDTFQMARVLIQLESSSKVIVKSSSVVEDIKENNLLSQNIPEKVPYVAFTNVTKSGTMDFGLNDDQFDFFQKRQQLNILDK